MESIVYKINFKDKEGKLQEKILFAHSIEMAKARLKSENEVREIIKIMELKSV